MNVCIVIDSVIPAPLYGGTQRVVVWLGRALVKMGHTVSYLARNGSTCDFAPVFPLDRNLTLDSQIPPGTDIVHLHSGLDFPQNTPACMTIHGNTSSPAIFHPNSIFVSEKHARNHNATAFVYNGLDPDEYGDIDLDSTRERLVFIGKAAWKVKNVRGAIKVAGLAGYPIDILGGYRLNFKMGFRLTLDYNAHFHGMIGGERKNSLLRHSLGLIFPVLWEEPFGLAIIECLYYGVPVFGTPYGSLPELIPPEVGFLSSNKQELSDAVKHASDYNKKLIHDWCMDNFTAEIMAKKYLTYYEKIVSGETLHKGPIHSPMTRSKQLLAWD